MAFGKREFLESLKPYKVRPAANDPVGRRFEHGTLQHELLAGFVAAVDYIESLGWEAITSHERQLGQRFLDGVPEAVQLYGLRTMEGRVPTFAFNLPGRTSEDAAIELAAREIAVWHGDYYAVEIMKQLGLEGSGAVRAGFVHYNTAAEVDRLLTALDELC
jgi:selenocysteine lyase/cysteine desulfurase